MSIPEGYVAAWSQEPVRAHEEALARSLPRTTEALWLASFLAEEAGDRLLHDAMGGGPPHMLAYLRDPDCPELVAPTPIVELHPDESIGEAEGYLPMVEALPGAPRSATLALHAGASRLELKYGRDGALRQILGTRGDVPPVADFRALPSLRDTASVLPSPAPHPFMLRDAPDPIRPVDLGKFLLDLPFPDSLVRAYLPVDQPGGVGSVVGRGTRLLAAAAWRGELGLDDADGWVVADAWRGVVRAFDPDLKRALARWKEQVALAPPMLPAEAIPRPLPEDFEPGTTTTEKMSEDGKSKLISTRASFVFTPRVLLPWPEGRPENVPAIAVRIRPLGHPPAAWRDAGFTQRFRSFQYDGTSRPVWVQRASPLTCAVGAWLAERYDPATLHALMDAGIERHRAEFQANPDFWFDGPPWETPKYPWITATLSGVDSMRRPTRPELRAVSFGPQSPIPTQDAEWMGVFMMRQTLHPKWTEAIPEE